MSLKQWKMYPEKKPAVKKTEKECLIRQICKRTLSSGSVIERMGVILRERERDRKRKSGHAIAWVYMYVQKSARAQESKRGRQRESERVSVEGLFCLPTQMESSK